MTAQKPTAPSPRVGLAFAIAAVIGALFFAIYWFTGMSGSRGSGPRPSSTQNSTPSSESGLHADDTTAVPRGGVLRGPVDPQAVVGKGYGGQANAVALLTQATLVRVNRSTDQLEPWLAESWTAAPDNLTFDITLRPKILWSDGTPFTASDVLVPLGVVRVLGKPLALRVISPLELEIKFPEAFSPGLRLLDSVPIVSAHGGLGPFLMAAGSPLVFERNPHYWRTAPDGKPLPYLDRIELDASADPNTSLQRLLDGEFDFIETELRPEDYTALKRADREDKVRLYNLGPGLAADGLFLGALGPEGSALRTNDVRLAISTAVGRREFCDAVYLGACEPVFGPVSPGNRAWFLDDLSAAGPDANLARAMLAGIGLQDRNKDGVLDDPAGHAIRLDVLVTRGQLSAERGAAFLKEQLKNVGIAIDVTTVNAAVLDDRRKKGNYDAIFGRYDPVDSDPALNLDFWLRSNGGTDWEKRLNELMLKVARSADRVERLQAFADAQKLYAEHMPVIFFGAPYTYVATNLRVRNVKPSGRSPALLWNADQLAVAGR